MRFAIIPLRVARNRRSLSMFVGKPASRQEVVVVVRMMSVNEANINDNNKHLNSSLMETLATAILNTSMDNGLSIHCAEPIRPWKILRNLPFLA